MTAEPCPPAPSDSRAAAATATGIAGSTRTSMVPPQARPDVPGLLVADAVADDPRMPRRAGPVDLLGRGALDAAAADRAGDPAVGGVQQDRALGPWRRPERADDDGTADIDAVAGPGIERLEQFLHRIGLGADGSVGMPPTTFGGAPTVGTTATGECRVGGGLAPPSRVAGADAAEDLAEPLEVGDRAGREEVVDVRDTRRASLRPAAGSRACPRAG